MFEARFCLSILKLWFTVNFTRTILLYVALYINCIKRFQLNKFLPLHWKWFLACKDDLILTTTESNLTITDHITIRYKEKHWSKATIVGTSYNSCKSYPNSLQYFCYFLCFWSTNVSRFSDKSLFDNFLWKYFCLKVDDFFTYTSFGR